MIPFTRSQQQALIGLSVFGLLVPNGVFLYYALIAPEVLRDAINNPVALVFMAEALLLMILGAWFINKQRLHSPGWLIFVLMSLVGSLAFSVPTFLYLVNRDRTGRRPGRK